MTTEEITAAIDAYFGDDSRTMQATYDGLTDVLEHLEFKINALGDDLDDQDTAVFDEELDDAEIP